MKKIISFLVVLIGLGSLSAQSFVGKINPFPPPEPLKLETGDTLNILAVMVEFKPDQDNATFGNGTFGSIYSKDYGSSIIDPLPHNKEYFEDHLTFARNYFKKNSNNKLNIAFTVLPAVITVSKTMRDYSPAISNENEFTPLANFCEEVWRLTDQNFSAIDFLSYDLFAIFHAGVGRDISISGSIGNERDLPSVYLSLNAFKNIYGGEFGGFAVDNGNSLITNTMILPETESREITGFGETTLIELSTNGLIVSSIASHLGLPDLFDTGTGLSAIGRFGLMDGQAIFAYGGLFPPGLSAWEKIYLGWQQPIVITNNGSINLSTQITAGDADTTLIKIPINSKEYFLVENRKRDARKDGCIITYKVNGDVRTITFENDTEEFNFYTIDALAGVIVDVDEYDWALPGEDRNTTYSEPFEDIGLIIWHIDENIIDTGLPYNRINNNKFRRGVKLVEADGIPDIGEEFQTIFGDVVIGEGSKEDTWYKTNPAELYKNIFSDGSNPDSRSNTGANSLITISDFPDISNEMNFKLTFGTENIYSVNTFNIRSDKKYKWINIIDVNSNPIIYITDSTGYSRFDIYGSELSRSELATNFHPALAAIFNYELFIGAEEDSLIIDHIEGTVIQRFKYGMAEKITCPPVVKKIDDISMYVLVGTENGLVYTIELKYYPPQFIRVIKSDHAFDSPVLQIASDGNSVCAIDKNNFWQEGNTAIPIPDVCNKVVLTKNSDDNYQAVVGCSNNKYYVIENGEHVFDNFPVYSENAGNNFNAANLRNDGENYILVNSFDGIDAFNLSGGKSDNFPLTDKFDSDFVLTPLALDLDRNSSDDVLSFTSDGKVYAHSGTTGNVIDHFPISVGTAPLISPIITEYKDGMLLLVLSSDYTVNIWNISNERITSGWFTEFADTKNSSFIGKASSENYISNFFPDARTYNWPNPVYDDYTNIRYYVSEDSDVEINIFDLAGDHVARIKDRGTGGFDNETRWNVSSIQSGIYFAHVKVNSVFGKSGYKIIKIAVIK